MDSEKRGGNKPVATISNTPHLNDRRVLAVRQTWSRPMSQPRAVDGHQTFPGKENEPFDFRKSSSVRSTRKRSKPYVPTADSFCSENNTTKRRLSADFDDKIQEESKQSIPASKTNRQNVKHCESVAHFAIFHDTRDGVAKKRRKILKNGDEGDGNETESWEIGDTEVQRNIEKIKNESQLATGHEEDKNASIHLLDSSRYSLPDNKLGIFDNGGVTDRNSIDPSPKSSNTEAHVTLVPKVIAKKSNCENSKVSIDDKTSIGDEFAKPNVVSSVSSNKCDHKLLGISDKSATGISSSVEEIPPTPDERPKFVKSIRKRLSRVKNFARRVDADEHALLLKHTEPENRDENLRRELLPTSRSVVTTITPRISAPLPVIPKVKEALHASKQKPSNYKRQIEELIPLAIQYTTAYIDDIIDVEYARENNCHKVSKMFLKGTTISELQRKIVINFLISVGEYLRASSSSLYQAAKMFDAVLDLYRDISIYDVQLVALGTLWIAIKHNETKVPSAQEMISFAKDLYSHNVALLCKCESKILKILEYRLIFPNPYYFTAYYLWSLRCTVNDAAIQQVYRCVNYMLDVALLEESLVRTSGALLAATATQTALCIVLEATCEKFDWSRWKTNEMKRFTETEMNETRLLILQGVLFSANNDLNILSVYKKHKQERYNNISCFLIDKVKEIGKHKESLGDKNGK